MISIQFWSTADDTMSSKWNKIYHTMYFQNLQFEDNLEAELEATES